MPHQSDVIYRYDGSFDGLLCCVFESYNKNELPLDIISPSTSASLLFSIKDILTDHEKATRVLSSIPLKMGNETLLFIRHAFLTCLYQKELYILLFLRLGYQHGPSVMHMLTDNVVHTLHKAVMHLDRESHLFKGFVRFSVVNNVLVGEIQPKNYVLPLMAEHFCERYPEECFLIYDKTHGMGLVYQPYQSAIIPIENLEIPEASNEELAFRRLWQLFYDTIEIKARHNPNCRRNLMPKRYWKFMTEFNRTANNQPSDYLPSPKTKPPEIIS